MHPESIEPNTRAVLEKIAGKNFLQPYANIYGTVPFEGIQLADERDIAAMKIDAISSRGSRKDFVDLYFLLEKYPLPEIISFFEKKFRGLQYNKLHILKSLLYFADAKNDPMPKMIKEISWDEVKKRIEGEVEKLPIQ